MPQVDNAVELITFVLALAGGGILCLLYDLFRIWRSTFRPTRWVAFWQDIVYWILCALTAYLFMLARCMGEIRGYVLLGMLMGWLLCRFTISRMVFVAGCTVMGVVRRIHRWIKHHVIRPVGRRVRAFRRFLWTKVVKIKGMLVNLLKNAKKHLKQQASVMYNHSNSSD